MHVEVGAVVIPNEVAAKCFQIIIAFNIIKRKQMKILLFGRKQESDNLLF